MAKYEGVQEAQGWADVRGHRAARREARPSKPVLIIDFSDQQIVGFHQFISADGASRRRRRRPLVGVSVLVGALCGRCGTTAAECCALWHQISASGTVADVHGRTVRDPFGQRIHIDTIDTLSDQTYMDQISRPVSPCARHSICTLLEPVGSLHMLATSARPSAQVSGSYSLLSPFSLPSICIAGEGSFSTRTTTYMHTHLPKLRHSTHGCSAGSSGASSTGEIFDTRDLSIPPVLYTLPATMASHVTFGITAATWTYLCSGLGLYVGIMSATLPRSLTHSLTLHTRPHSMRTHLTGTHTYALLSHARSQTRRHRV